MDQDIQQQIDSLFAEDDNKSDNNGVFLNEENLDNPIKSKEEAQKDKIDSANEEELNKQDDPRPLYEQYSYGSQQPATEKSLSSKELEKKIEDTYGSSYPDEKAGTQDSGRDSSILNITSQEKQDELKEKMRSIDINEKEKEVRTNAANLGFGYINLKGIPILPDALRVVSEEESKKLGIICFYFRERKEIRIAILKENIAKQEVRELIRQIMDNYGNVQVNLYITSQESMSYALKMYKTLPKIEIQTDEIKILEQDIAKQNEEISNLSQLEEKCKKANATEILSLIISTAIKTEASDIHIEAEKNGIQLRFRIDGILHDAAALSKDIWDKLISRIKLNSKLKLNIKDKPQDGNFSAHMGKQEVDFRVSTLPTAYGESIVMRILYHEKIKGFTLDKLGIGEHIEKILLEEIEKPNGMIVVTGPTGSGKTTTLYAILNKLNTQDNKIITIEDPIEYIIEGVNQSEVNEEKGYTFAKGLRSIVRQDPDIILIGEIRDQETVDIALNAALTGHLVFSTIHANSAAGVIARFLALNAKPYLLAPAVNVSIAQRLVRRICPDCKQKDSPNERTQEKIRQELEVIPDHLKHKFNIDLNSMQFYKGQGCDKCNGIGYKGQVGLFEIFQITDETRDMILIGDISEHKLTQIAIQKGMITMVQDGILKAINGVTSLDEVFRVVQ
ncbi:MAG: ATPase, T2SS/T4P/T4SS family [Candidatus Kuenenbacteria bacterium]